MSAVKEREALGLDAIKQSPARMPGRTALICSLIIIWPSCRELLAAASAIQCSAPSAIISLLELRSSWGEGDVEYFDFTLTGEVTDYVVSVHFDHTGSIDSVSMES